MAFVHLHTHSEYSLLDGANRIPELLDRIHALGMDSLAITDHGNLHGAWQFHAEARARQLRPILGFEAYLAFGSRHKRERAPEAPAAYPHLVLLPENRPRSPPWSPPALAGAATSASGRRRLPPPTRTSYCSRRTAPATGISSSSRPSASSRAIIAAPASIAKCSSSITRA